MLDAYARPLIDPPLNAVGRRLAGWGIGADTVTLVGLAIGIVACWLIWAGAFAAAFVVIVISRLADGLDGAVARASRQTDYGGYLDIAADFLFYGLLPLAFVFHDPEANALAGAFVLASFYFNAASFLGYAILAEKRGMETAEQGQKTLYFSNGILEGTETIGFFLLLCVFPGAFAPIAFVFGALCYLTAALRIAAAARVFRG